MAHIYYQFYPQTYPSIDDAVFRHATLASDYPTPQEAAYRNLRKIQYGHGLFDVQRRTPRLYGPTLVRNHQPEGPFINDALSHALNQAREYAGSLTCGHAHNHVTRHPSILLRQSPESKKTNTERLLNYLGLQLPESGNMLQKPTPPPKPAQKKKVMFKPMVDFNETPFEYVIRVPIPGAQKKNISLTYNTEESTLYLSGVIHKPYVRMALRAAVATSGKDGDIAVFQRNIRLGNTHQPAYVDVDNIRTDLTDGILTIHVPKVVSFGHGFQFRTIVDFMNKENGEQGLTGATDNVKEKEQQVEEKGKQVEQEVEEKGKQVEQEVEEKAEKVFELHEQEAKEGVDTEADILSMEVDSGTEAGNEISEPVRRSPPNPSVRDEEDEEKDYIVVDES
ncbi:hypothetical protein AJ79_02105 [Helicocarpus griseus UAMH5409]|uniref:SHSP domain-containing protein n=1 Tax=Helicocarpus griseus UAMH5409 TaxID=1447875 RepID=A0A2B7Y4Y2_9EURO|nr:hypothetical protein AJ79_02105 [Helicocarpus griseus UAMH5409]